MSVWLIVIENTKPEERGIKSLMLSYVRKVATGRAGTRRESNGHVRDLFAQMHIGHGVMQVDTRKFAFAEINTLRPILKQHIGLSSEKGEPCPTSGKHELFL